MSRLERAGELLNELLFALYSMLRDHTVVSYVTLARIDNEYTKGRGVARGGKLPVKLERGKGDASGFGCSGLLAKQKVD
nr:hypothetical protein BaRGS_024554 [Batillaria attramentaria]